MGQTHTCQSLLYFVIITRRPTQRFHFNYYIIFYFIVFADRFVIVLSITLLTLVLSHLIAACYNKLFRTFSYLKTLFCRLAFTHHLTTITLKYTVHSPPLLTGLSIGQLRRE